MKSIIMAFAIAFIAIAGFGISTASACPGDPNCQCQEKMGVDGKMKPCEHMMGDMKDGKMKTCEKCMKKMSKPCQMCEKTGQNCDQCMDGKPHRVKIDDGSYNNRGSLTLKSGESMKSRAYNYNE